MWKGIVSFMQLWALQSFCFSSFCPLTQPSSPDIQNPWEVSHSSSGEGEEASPTFHLISWGDCPPSKSCRKIHAFRRRPTGTFRQQSCTLQAGEPSSCANISELSPWPKSQNANEYANKKGTWLKHPTWLATALIWNQDTWFRGTIYTVLLQTLPDF